MFSKANIPSELNWGGKIMFLFVGAELFIMAGLYFFQPETKNRTNVEIEALYASKIPARKFSDYEVVDGQVVERKGASGFLGRFSRKA